MGGRVTLRWPLGLLPQKQFSAMGLSCPVPSSFSSPSVSNLGTGADVSREKEPRGGGLACRLRMTPEFRSSGVFVRAWGGSPYSATPKGLRERKNVGFQSHPPGAWLACWLHVSIRAGSERQWLKKTFTKQPAH